MKEAGYANRTITPIGVTNHQNKHIPFGIKKADRLGHIYCIGKTGTGKSTLLLNMALADITDGEGVCIIDPHGDLSETILEYIPRERIRDVVYFNAGDSEFPISFNPLAAPSDQYLAADALVSAFKKLWADSWGPRLEHILRNTLLTLLQYPSATLLDIVPLLTDYDFRRHVLPYVTDSSLRDFWLKEFQPLPPQLKSEFIAPIINKVGLFSTHPLIRNIVGQKVSKIVIPEIMNGQKIFIANLSKGFLGEAGTQLLGSLLIAQFQTSSLGRAKQPVPSRTPFYLFIDEAHSFMTLAFADILSESRKYGLGLFLTHQFMEQLSEDIRSAIVGNVGTLIVFRVGSADAEVLLSEFAPVFTAEDLVRVPKYGVYLKLLIDGTQSEPFSATTLPLPFKKSLGKEDILNASRHWYGRPVDEIITELHGKTQSSRFRHNQETLF
jgi:energy-coupling factor transporter ATP-binding protein EcfA2